MTAQPSASAMPMNMTREDLAEHAGVAADGHAAPNGRDADADGGAGEGETDVNVTVDFCEHHMFFLSLVLACRARHWCRGEI